LILLVVHCFIRVFRGEVVRSNPIVAHDTLPGTKPPNEELVQHIISVLGVHMLFSTLHRIFDIPSGILEDELFTAGVIREEVGDIENFTPVCNPAAALRIVLESI
jgi:hypothetical protein